MIGLMRFVSTPAGVPEVFELPQDEASLSTEQSGTVPSIA